jgi:hypothetical protein
LLPLLQVNKLGSIKINNIEERCLKDLGRGEKSKNSRKFWKLNNEILNSLVWVAIYKIIYEKYYMSEKSTICLL